jgi:hypothetical protein
LNLQSRSYTTEFKPKKSRSPSRRDIRPVRLVVVIITTLLILLSPGFGQDIGWDLALPNFAFFHIHPVSEFIKSITLHGSELGQAFKPFRGLFLAGSKNSDLVSLYYQVIVLQNSLRGLCIRVPILETDETGSRDSVHVITNLTVKMILSLDQAFRTGLEFGV